MVLALSRRSVSHGAFTPSIPDVPAAAQPGAAAAATSEPAAAAAELHP